MREKSTLRGNTRWHSASVAALLLATACGDEDSTQSTADTGGSSSALDTGDASTAADDGGSTASDGSTTSGTAGESSVGTDSTGGAIGNGLIAFAGADEQGRQQIFTITIEGTERTQLTFDGENSMPSWSPDGARLVYVSRTGISPDALWIMDEDGGNKHELVDGDAPDWGPNDQIVYTIAGMAGQPSEIGVVGADGGAPQQVTSGGDHQGRVHPSWSPDGERFVYMQLTPQDMGSEDTSNGCPALPFRAELWTCDADGSDSALLTTTDFSNVDAGGQLINSAADANAPDWSRSGDFIAFWSGQEQCYGQVWRIHPDGSGRAQLSEAPIPSHNDDPAWSPDGTQVLFTTDRDGQPETWVMDADGGNPRFVTEAKPGPGPGDAAWQPVWL